MLSKADIHFVRSLQQKEARTESGMYAAEGEKLVKEMIERGIRPEMLIGTETWLNDHQALTRTLGNAVYTAGEKDMERCSAFKSPSGVIAVCRIPQRKDPSEISGGFGLALDDVQDPGNVGTMLRIAVWFGLDFILCSPGCADLYNPKVIQASMGAFYRIPVITGMLDEHLQQFSAKGFTLASAVMKGTAVGTVDVPSNLIVILGNESKGVRHELQALSTLKITIPGISGGEKGIESLNVSTAAAVICYEFSKKRFHEDRQ